MRLMLKLLQLMEEDVNEFFTFYDDHMYIIQKKCEGDFFIELKLFIYVFNNVMKSDHMC